MRAITRHRARTTTIMGKVCLLLAVLVIASISTVECRRKHHRNHKTNDPVPDEWDWRTKGAVFPVIDQGEIGNSLALDAAEVISSYGFIKTGKLIKASVEELIDCCLNSTRTGNIDDHLQKVRGDDVYSCVVKLHGLCWAADYPPVSQPQACMASKCQPEVLINGGQTVAAGDANAMKAAVYANPALVYINAACLSFQTYQSGVYEDKSCDPTMLDHVLQVVGYGQMDGKDVWYCKNSWGVNWGDQGYIYIARGENIIGIESQASIPV